MELWARNCQVILPKFRLPRKFRDLLHAANLRHGTDGFTSPPKEGVLRIFFRPKNPTASAGFEPANLGTKGQHATPRPPKPLSEDGSLVLAVLKRRFQCPRSDLTGHMAGICHPTLFAVFRFQD